MIAYLANLAVHVAASGFAASGSGCGTLLGLDFDYIHARNTDASATILSADRNAADGR